MHPLKRPVTLPETSDSPYDGPETRTTILPAGYRKGHDRAPFRTATIFEKDTTITLRDGTQIRADIFRPSGTADPVPALIAWGPYGKTGRGSISFLRSFSPMNLLILVRLFTLGGYTRSRRRPARKTIRV